jgi:hypothetical protein
MSDSTRQAHLPGSPSCSQNNLAQPGVHGQHQSQLLRARRFERERIVYVLEQYRPDRINLAYEGVVVCLYINVLVRRRVKWIVRVKDCLWVAGRVLSEEVPRLAFSPTCASVTTPLPTA